MIDKKIKFIPINIAILTISDTRVLNNDKSGDLLENKIIQSKHSVYSRDIVRDEKKELLFKLNTLIKIDDIDVIITTGGTGLTGRDITPETVNEWFDKSIDGFGEMF